MKDTSIKHSKAYHILKNKNNQNIMVEADGTIICKASVVFEANGPWTLTDVKVAAPKAGEVRVKVIANALCHTDVYTQSG